MIDLRWARPDERDHLQNYLFEKMGKIPHKRWRNILDCRWNTVDERYGIVAEENGVIAGFLGIVFSDRDISGTPHRTGNITSWFLEKHLRRAGLGQEMLSLITESAGVTYTATSANFRSGALLKKIGWELLEDTRYFWHRTGKPMTPGLTLLTGISALRDRLSSGDAKTIEDHSGLNLTPHQLSTPNGERLFFVSYEKLKGDDKTTHYEILHSSSSSVLSKHVNDIANLLLPEENAVLSADKRFLATSAIAHSSLDLPVPRYFKPSGKLSAGEVDFLYGEVVLLDLKIY